jgi:hypothetical protein
MRGDGDLREYGWLLHVRVQGGLHRQWRHLHGRERVRSEQRGMRRDRDVHEYARELHLRMQARVHR